MIYPRRFVLAFVAGGSIGFCGAHCALGVIVFGSQGNNFLPATPVPISTNGHTLDQYEGAFGPSPGTPIAPRFFVTANHVTINTTGSFIFNNGTAAATTYPVQLAGVEDDLAIWEISPSDPDSFSLYAPLYTSGTELNQPLLVLGNGTARGSAITGGWNWGPATGQTSWGTNTVAAIPVAGQNNFQPPANFGGDFIQYAFDPTANNPDEAIVSGGDSGGGLFVLDPADNTYKLAGVNSLVDQVLDSSGNLLDAALYDDNGYFTFNDANQVVPITDHDPLSSYATRISSRIGFVNSVANPFPVAVAGGQIFHFNTNGGTGVSVIYNTGLAIDATGTAVVPVAASGTTRQLLVVQGSGLSLAGTAGNWTGLLDLGDNAAVLSGASLTTVVDQVRQGYANRTWAGTGGITSSAAAANPRNGLAVIQNNGSGTALFSATNLFDGFAPEPSDVLIKYTLVGDTNLDGVVNFTDLLALAQHYNQSGTSWLTGDFNYDGQTDFNDLLGLAQNFNTDMALTGGQLAELDTLGGIDFAAAWAEVETAVPEPGGIFAVVAIGAVLRRGRSRLR